MTKSANPITPRTTFHVLMPPIVGTTARATPATATRMPADKRASAERTFINLGPLHYTS